MCQKYGSANSTESFRLEILRKLQHRQTAENARSSQRFKCADDDWQKAGCIRSILFHVAVVNESNDSVRSAKPVYWICTPLLVRSRPDVV